MDLLRGGAIILVVVFHATTISARYEIATPAWIQVFLDFLAPFRMPLLMFLSGMLLPRSLTKPSRAYFSGKARSILWPYVVWSLVFLLVSNEISAKRLVQVVVMPPTYLWFLWFLFAYYALAWLAFKWRFGPYVLLGVALIGMFGPDAYRFARFWYLLVFFLLGALLLPWLTRLSDSARKTALVIAVPLLVLGIGGGLLSVGGSDVQYSPVLIPLAISGVVGVIVLAARINRRWLPRGLVTVGVNSIVFYVTHFTIMWVVIAVLTWFGVTDPLITIGAALVIAIAGGAGFVALRKFALVEVLFSFPQRAIRGQSTDSPR